MCTPWNVVMEERRGCQGSVTHTPDPKRGLRSSSAVGPGTLYTRRAHAHPWLPGTESALFARSLGTCRALNLEKQRGPLYADAVLSGVWAEAIPPLGSWIEMQILKLHPEPGKAESPNFGESWAPGSSMGSSDDSYARCSPGLPQGHPSQRRLC